MSDPTVPTGPQANSPESWTATSEAGSPTAPQTPAPEQAAAPPDLPPPPPPAPTGFPPPAPQGYAPPAQGSAPPTAGYPAPPQANPYGGYSGVPSAGYGPPTEGTLTYVQSHFGPVASFGQRAGAYLIDALVVLPGSLVSTIGLIMMLLSFPRDEYNVETGTYDTTGSGATVGIATLVVVLGALVGLGLWLWNRVFRMGRTGQSVGKRVMGLKLIDARTGQPIGAGSSFLREIVQYLANSIIYLSFLWMLWDANKQTLADLSVASTVITVPKA